MLAVTTLDKWFLKKVGCVIATAETTGILRVTGKRRSLKASNSVRLVLLLSSTPSSIAG